MWNSSKKRKVGGIDAPIEILIIKTLKGNREPLSTYSIAKLLGVSWSTVNAHCYKLKSTGTIDGRMESSQLGQKKVVWYLEEK